MMALRPKSSLPPGFRFHPTDVELVCYYLKRKVMGKCFRFQAISEIELYKYAPWDLPAMSLLRSNDLEWYFFCPRDKKYPNGSRANRTTNIGYWKATGKDRSIIHNLRTIGMKKTLIFHEGKPPKAIRTDWVMYEYRLDDSEVRDAGFLQEAYVLCKIFQKSGLGPKIGEEYGAPFNEEEWEDDMITDNSFSLPSCSLSRPVINDPVPVNTVCEQPATDTIAEASSYVDVANADGMSLEDLTELMYPPPIMENTLCEMPNPVIPHGNTTGDSAAEPELFNELETNTDGMSLEDLMELLYPSPIMETTFCEMPNVVIPHGNTFGDSAAEHELFNELEDVSAQVATSAEIDYPDILLDENVYYPVLSQLYSDGYLELNDFGRLDKIYPSQDLSNMYDHSYFKNDFTMSELHNSIQSEAKHVKHSSVTLQAHI